MKELNQVAVLITEKNSERNSNGFSEDVILLNKEVFVAENSVKRTEYYAALREGFKVNIILTVNIDDYNECIVKENGEKYLPQKVIYDETVYLILRTYKTDEQYMELTLMETE